MDRFLSLDCGRTFSIFQNHISIAFPEKFIDNGWQSSLTYGLVKLAFTLKEMESDPDFLMPDHKVLKMTEELLKWNASMEEFGLGDDAMIAKAPYSIGLVSQFRLMYYNVLYFIHMRSVFNLVDSSVCHNHPNVEVLLDAIRGVNKVTDIMVQKNALLTPWWLALNVLYHSGCLCLLFISNNIHSTEMGSQLSKIIEKTSLIAKDDRFIMAKECLWSLKTLNHMLLYA